MNDLKQRTATASGSSACPVRRVGAGPGHHFFGYYNKTNWDPSGRFLLGHETDVLTADLVPDLVAKVGYFDLQDEDRFIVLDETTTWNWQMGSQLQWLSDDGGRRVIYNSRTGDDASFYPGLGSTICNVDTGEKRLLPMPLYVVAPDSRYALCVDYRRLYVTHQTIGYSEASGPHVMAAAPAEDGIHRMDLATGQSRLILSYADLSSFYRKPSMDRAIHWVSHIEINPSSSRLLLLHRWTERVADETCFLHRLITVDPDGGNLRLLECSDHPLPQLAKDFDPNAVGTFDYEKSEYQISHPLWKNDRQIIVWGPHDGSIHYHLYDDDDQGRVEVVGGGVLVENGHMSYSPTDPRWLLTDTYPDDETQERTLLLYNVETGRRHDLGSFYADPGLGKENRCDLHPRWRPDGQMVCVDSVHEGERQMYLVDVSTITGHQELLA